MQNKHIQVLTYIYFHIFFEKKEILTIVIFVDLGKWILCITGCLKIVPTYFHNLQILRFISNPL